MTGGLEKKRRERRINLASPARPSENLLRVAAEGLAVVPNTENFRAALAKEVLGRYEELEKGFRRIRASGSIRLKSIVSWAVSGTSPARSILRTKPTRKRWGFGGSRQEFPQVPEYRRWLVEAHMDRGELNRMYGKTADAEQDLHAAIADAAGLLSQGDWALYSRGKALRPHQPV